MNDNPTSIDLAPYNPEWPATFLILARQIREALGDRVLSLEHVGSTSVPELSAKPVIDTVLAVQNSADEASYFPSIEALGYTLVFVSPNGLSIA